MKKGLPILLSLVLLVGVSGVSGEEQPLVLTLDQSIDLALKQNPALLAAGERVRSAEYGIREAVSGFFPAVTGQGLATLDEKLFSLEFPSMIPGQPPQTFEVDFTRDYQFALSFIQPLYTGGKLLSGFRTARYNLEATREGVRQSKHMLVFNTKRAFYGYLLAKEFVKVAAEAVEVAEKHHRTVKTQYEVGLASKFDLLRSEVQVANLKPQLIRARNNQQVAELSFKTLLGLDLSRPVEIQGELEYVPVDPDLEASLDNAVQNRPEINQLMIQQKMAGEMLKMVRSEYLPSLALSATYNFWGDSFRFNNDPWQNYYAVNLVLSVPIFNGFATASRIAKSRAALRELEFSQKGIEDAVHFEVNQALLKLKEARESLISQEKNVDQAKESLRIAELTFAEGLATSLDVSSVQAALSQAKTNHTQALFDYVLAKADLDKAIGVGWKIDD